MKKLILTALLLTISTICFTQETNNFLQDAIKIYIDCDDCDMNFIREEIQFVNYVRDRKVADVHIIFSDQNTGGGGEEYTVEFIGLGRFQNVNNELVFIKTKSDSEDDFRIQSVNTLRLGLVRYAAKTPIGKDISISYNKPQTEKVEEKDPWNNWVYSISGSGWLNGEKSRHYYSLDGAVSVRRITNEQKIFFSSDYSHSKNSYSDLDYETTSKYMNFYSSFINSMNDHWSYGGWLNARQSDYENLDLAISLKPGIEYNIFPYSDYNKKQIRIQYFLAAEYGDYQQKTVYERTNDKTINQSIVVAAEVIRSWGSISANITASDYLVINKGVFQDLEKNKFTFYGRTSLNLYEGFSIGFFGYISLIHDQISLPGGEVSTEELLLQQRQLETQYSYMGSLSLSYTFGSVYNNIVNPRFGG